MTHVKSKSDITAPPTARISRLGSIPLFGASPAMMATKRNMIANGINANPAKIRTNKSMARNADALLFDGLSGGNSLR
jgi:hypothetical protein